jgi:hypothetical protein
MHGLLFAAIERVVRGAERPRDAAIDEVTEPPRRGRVDKQTRGIDDAELVAGDAADLVIEATSVPEGEKTDARLVQELIAEDVRVGD